MFFLTSCLPCRGKRPACNRYPTQCPERPSGRRARVDVGVMFLLLTGVFGSATSAAAESFTLDNETYRLTFDGEGAVRVSLIDDADRASQPLVFRSAFAVMYAADDPRCVRNASHPNYPVAPRAAVRWHAPHLSLDELNAWVGANEFAAVTGMRGEVRDDAPEKSSAIGTAKSGGRRWEYRNADGRATVAVAGAAAYDTTNPFRVGRTTIPRPTKVIGPGEKGTGEERADAGRRVAVEFDPHDDFELRAEWFLPAGTGDPQITYVLTPRRDGYYSVAYVGAPSWPARSLTPVPQECAARGFKQFDFVMSEADLHLPRVHTVADDWNIVLTPDPRECRFRLPTMADSRFGLMLETTGDGVRPVVSAPLLGGYESKSSVGESRRFTLRAVVRRGDWKEAYVYTAREIHGFRDLRDNSGPGSLNDTLHRIVDFLADRSGRNYAMWDEQQKYYDYFTDKTGVYKPFSPLFGLATSIVVDDEDFFRRRARPAVEFALSRPTNVFAPYEAVDNKQANSAGRTVGRPYVGYAQLASLHAFFQGRTPALRALAEVVGPSKGKIADALAEARLTGRREALEDLMKDVAERRSSRAAFAEEDFFDLLDLAAETGLPAASAAVREAAYHHAAKVNLYPRPPEENVIVDRGGRAPIHLHSFGRHRNVWGYPTPVGLPLPERSVPAWRLARLGVPGIAYPMEYWMNGHGAMLRTAGLTSDPFLRDVARSGMVGRFGNFPGDNRSHDSLVAELPDTAEHRPWDWNFATFNPGHAWDFAAQVLDFLVSDAYERSGGAIDFPAESAARSNFRVRVYGARPGAFYGDDQVRLWLPRGLVDTGNAQFDWIAGHGNGRFYFAIMNQSFREETGAIQFDRSFVECDADRPARVWRNNRAVDDVRIRDNRVTLTVPPKGIVAISVPAAVHPGLQAKLYADDATTLGPYSHVTAEASFGVIHGMLLKAGRGLTSAFVYTEALPERVIAARLWWRQGDGSWNVVVDEVYPYEFSPDLNNEVGPFVCVMEIKDDQRRLVRSQPIALSFDDAPAPTKGVLPPSEPWIRDSKSPPADDSSPPSTEEAESFSDDFVGYLKHAANVGSFGLRDDGRFYPYSTPLGRRIGWRFSVWDDHLYADGLSVAEAEARLRADLRRVQAGLSQRLGQRRPAVEWRTLDRRRRETLLDFGFSEGVDRLNAELVESVLAADWETMVAKHLYVRYLGHAPDHARNKAFAERWGIH